MTRYYTITDIIQLPRLNARKALTLGRQLLTTADAQEADLQASGSDLPVFIARPLARLRDRVSALEVALTPREAQDPEVKLEADSAVDLAWGLVRNWMDSQMALPESLNPRLEDLTRLYGVLFPDGLTFLTLSFREEWAESETRLKYIADQGYDTLFHDLGGEVYLENLKQAHARYGEVLGITTPVAEDSQEGVANPMKDAVTSMKEYVFKVLAWADPEEPGSDTLGQALLVPLTEWDDGTPSSGESEAATEAIDSPEGSSNVDASADDTAPGEPGDPA